MAAKPRRLKLRRDVVDGGSIGYLEMFHNHSWHSVCADGLNAKVANVICSQLGYDGAIAIGDVGIKTPTPDGKQLSLSNLTCSGLEMTTRDCTRKMNWVTGACKGQRVAALLCRG